MPRDRTVLVTGPRGLLGSAVCEGFVAAGYTVLPFEGDIRDVDSVHAFFLNTLPSWVIHTAAKTNVAACEKNPDETYAINVDGTAHVIEAARLCGAAVVHISTASVFKGDKGDYTERDVPEPTNVYNQTKADAEKVVLGYEKGKVVRLNIVGIHPKGSRGRNFLEWLVDSFQNNKNLTLFTDSRINPLSNWTIAEMLQKIIEQAPDEKIFHIGSRNVVSKAEIGKLVHTHFPNYSGVVREGSIVSIEDGVFRPKEMWLNAESTSKILAVSMPNIEKEIEKIFSRIID